jgi:2-succinyl-6-hydroxy-2,4-cyclohexadiene-1-carboxylate synthase
MTTTLGSTSRLVTIDGDIVARIRCAARGPVLWIHGYTLDSGTWVELWDRLPGWSHVGIDLPGHGDSPPLAPDADLPDLAERIGRLAVELGAQHLVALSFGTTLAVEIAGRYPGTIQTLVLGAPSLAGGPADLPTRLRYRELMQAHGRLGPGPHLGALWTQEASEIFRYARRRPQLWRLLCATVGRHRWPELRDGSMRRLLAHHQDDALLRRITAHTLLLVGEHEMSAFAACAARIEAVVSSCRRVDLPAVGHLCLLEDPDTAARLIESHLSASRPRSTGHCEGTE